MISKNVIFVLFVFSVLVISGCTQTVEEEKVVTDTSLIDVQASGKLVVGAIPDYPPMEYIDESGEFVGYDLDVTREIAAQMGVATEFKQIPWGELFDAVKSGEVDIIISAITITPERQEEMLFSVPYFDAGQVITVRVENDDIKGPEDLNGTKVGVSAGTTCEQAVLEYADRESVIGYPGYEEIIEDLKAGEIDALVTDLIGSSGYVKENPDDLKMVGEPFTQEYYGIATNLDNVALMDEINKILRNMKTTGKLKDLKSTWL